MTANADATARPGQGRALTQRNSGTAREADLTPQGQQVPDDPIALPEGWLACSACGVAVPGADPALVLEPQGREGAAYVPLHQAYFEMGFAHCPPCRELAARAQQLVAEGPGRLALLGDAKTIAYRVENGLYALAALGLDAQAADIDVEALLRHLAVPGAGARWSARFFPTIEADAVVTSCSPHPWAHVRLGLRADLRARYAGLLRERIARGAPPVALAPPPISAGPEQGVPLPGGCLLCGVGKIWLPATQAARRDVWHPLSAPASSLGGGQSPDRVAGYTCPPCADAVEWVGSVGPTAMERALDEHLRSTERGELAGRLALGELEGLISWGALAYADQRAGRALPAANTEPWGHCRLP